MPTSVGAAMTQRSAALAGNCTGGSTLLPPLPPPPPQALNSKLRAALSASAVLHLGFWSRLLFTEVRFMVAWIIVNKIIHSNKLLAALGESFAKPARVQTRLRSAPSRRG
jgi:hypothetical protein